MRIIEPYFEVLSEINEEEILKKLELIGRVCYKSENNITISSSKNFISKLIRNGHESVIEHVSISVKVICDRGVSHEIVRHRLASYSQESTRYCNYTKDKFGNELTFIKPFFWEYEPKKYNIWLNSMQIIENYYNVLIENGATAEEARTVLPNSLKTEIVMTMNLREWRHFFKLRTDKKSHPQMREISIMILEYFQNELPSVFIDI